MSSQQLNLIEIITMCFNCAMSYLNTLNRARHMIITSDATCNVIANNVGAMHFIYDISRLTTTKVDST